jgi:hypothetical protein
MLLRIGDTTPPYEQYGIMRSADFPMLVSALRAVEHCA